jgi:hypothetical protein
MNQLLVARGCNTRRITCSNRCLQCAKHLQQLRLGHLLQLLLHGVDSRAGKGAEQTIK